MTRYAWVDSLEAYCFTVIRGIQVDEVIRRLGGDPAGCAPRTFDECFWRPEEPQWLQLGPVDGAPGGAAPGGAATGALLCAENNGWRLSEDDTAAALSRGGWLVSMFCDVSAVMRFGYAVDGTLRAAFDPLLDKRPEEGTDPRCLDRLLAGLSFDLDGVARASMTLLERVSGIRVEQSWLAAQQPAFPLPPLR